MFLLHAQIFYNMQQTAYNINFSQYNLHLESLTFNSIIKALL